MAQWVRIGTTERESENIHRGDSIPYSTPSLAFTVQTSTVLFSLKSKTTVRRREVHVQRVPRHCAEVLTEVSHRVTVVDQKLSSHVRGVQVIRLGLGRMDLTNSFALGRWSEGNPKSRFYLEIYLRILYKLHRNGLDK